MREKNRIAFSVRPFRRTKDGCRLPAQTFPPEPATSADLHGLPATPRWPRAPGHLQPCQTMLVFHPLQIDQSAKLSQLVRASESMIRSGLSARACHATQDCITAATRRRGPEHPGLCGLNILDDGFNFAFIWAWGWKGRFLSPNGFFAGPFSSTAFEKRMTISMGLLQSLACETTH